MNQFHLSSIPDDGKFINKFFFEKLKNFQQQHKIALFKYKSKVKNHVTLPRYKHGFQLTKANSRKRL
jgi:hypothetical protein